MPKSKYFPFGFWNSPTAVVPPPPKLSDGSDGDLVILNGQTVQITAGNIYSYNSIDIQSGGTLEIIGAEAWTQIACRNAFNLDGTIRGRTTEDATTYTLSADNWGLGGPYSHTVLQAPGGQGGCAQHEYSNGSTNAGGAQFNGHGGGGNGLNPGDADPGSPRPACVVSIQGGNGVSNGTNATIYTVTLGNCYSSSFTALGGTGNLGGHGQPPIAPSNWADEASAFANTRGGNGGGGGGGAGVPDTYKGNWYSAQSGAGGGARGAHGRHVFILAEEGITGSGTIDMNGDNGFNGAGLPAGNGGLQSGGGGGGAGGSAGKVAIRYPSANSITPTILTTGGAGGSRSPINSGYAQTNGGYHNPENSAREHKNGSNGFNTLVNDIGTY